MPVCNLQENCKFRTKLRSGSSIIATKPVFTYNSKNLFITNGNHIKVYSIDSGECVHTLKHHKSRVISLQVNAGNFLQVYSCSEDGTVACWDQNEGALLETVVIDTEQPVLCFYAPFHSNWFITKEIKNKENLYALYSCLINSKSKRKIVKTERILKGVLPRENAVAYGCNNKVIASVNGSRICVYEIEEKQFVWHESGKRNLECIALHPSELVFAVGDSNGQILVWSNILDYAGVIKSMYHWHALPVADLVFSSEGSYLYSGGEEGALLKWNLNSEDKHVLPRLGAPICKLARSGDNAYILTAHQDNTVQVINSERRVVQVIQGLGQGHTGGGNQKTNVSCGLLFDHISKSLVMNGGPGKLQFFHAYEDKKLFNLDISGRNIVSRTQTTEVFYPDIQKAAFNDKSNWLASVEYWSDGKASPQIWLKFWEYKDTRQTYVLNTNYFLPHYKEINCIVFQPESSLAITTSNDGKFKVWTLILDPKFPDKETWCCVSSGYYRDLPAGDACFSQDGSLLAVAFEDIITLWIVPNTELKFVCFNETNKRNIKQLVFGRKECQHLLVSQDGSSFTIWNLLSLSIIGQVSTEVQLIVPDMNSRFMACFSEDQGVYLFSPDNGEPMHYVGEITNKAIAAGVFVPKKGSDGKEKSQLIFMDFDQNIFTLTDDDIEPEDQDVSKVPIKRNIPVTPFGMLQAESSVSSVVKQEAELFVDNTITEKDFNEITNPTYVDLDDMCSKYLNQMLIPMKKQGENEVFETENNEEEMQDNESDENDIDENESFIFE